MRSGVDTQFLGVASTESLALNLCAFAVVTRSSSIGKAYLDAVAWENHKDKERYFKQLQENEPAVLKTVENLSLDAVDDIDVLNEKLQPFFRKIGRAERWCEIEEAEIDQPIYLD